jgi:enoyl-[acyl-carrier protein] reductase/trans-2-enoyl-CoA reductase (NAD+)
MPESIVQPKIRGFISLTSHPAGCAENVHSQIREIEARMLPGKTDRTIKNALIIGSSTGYGLGAALTACFGYKARTLGVCFEKSPDNTKTGTAGWYNSAAANHAAEKNGLRYKTINGDAFSDEVKQQVVEQLRDEYGPIDTLIYSLAAPRRNNPLGDHWNSVLKPIGQVYSGKSFDLRQEKISHIEIQPATEEEIDSTIKVMGGEDWESWVALLDRENLLAPNFKTVAFSYIGPDLTKDLYRDGTIGRAKAHLESTADTIHELVNQNPKLRGDGSGGAWISVNKAVVTQASSAIPVVGLYMSILFRILNNRGENESTCGQGIRLFQDYLMQSSSVKTDDSRRIRLDNFEMLPEVQEQVTTIWGDITNDNLAELADWPYFKNEFARLFGFNMEETNYDKPVELDIPLNG